MNNELSRPNDERRLSELLHVIQIDAAKPDPARLDAIRAAAAAEFESSSDDLNSRPRSRGGPRKETESSPRSRVGLGKDPDKGNRMFTLGIRTAVALAMSVAAIVAWFGISAPTTVAGTPTFGEVLASLRQVQSLQLRVERAGQQIDVWVRAPGLVRWEESPQRYRIAAGSRLWKIDEDENSASESPSPWFISPDEQVDLLSLLDVDVTDATPLLTARAQRREQYDDRECFVYTQRLPTGQESGAARSVEIEAFVDARTKQLAAVRAWPVLPRGEFRRLPLAEMRLVAVNVAIDDEKFVVVKSLTDDGRIGKLTESQGIVVLRPMLARRWTPIVREMLLKPGDWLRSDIRGTNAAKVTLANNVELTLGPGTLVELVSATQAALHQGQLQIHVPDGSPPDAALELTAPRDVRRTFAKAGKSLVRVDRDERLVDVPTTPIWLAGFEGTSSNESLGSLIVNLPDGRNEPLTVGDHKVTVEIRDQIARTTIEESFVNHTAGRLEGVFHFPLPQDASISGFGMWIGDQLIEADVVEKQRAREIYETILHEKRDPGLLEWTGGNIFKARVFPIEPRSEKRIKIVYTQVLPLRANRYRYSYGLRSELLRTRPLRSLALTVTVNSALSLKSVTCPTHSTRNQQTEHSAQVEFSAQEYTPSRDFEVVCEISGKQSDVVVVPHRRGDDGYFLMQLTPPAEEGQFQREVLPDGQPLQIVLVCDTSASMDSENRRQQAEFVAAVLSSLGPDDRFLLGAADVGVGWATPEPAAPTAENLAAAEKFLAQRDSLGWTDLDRAFAEVVKRAPADAQVIYVGDGIVTAGDTDAAAFVKRFGQLIGTGGAEANPAGARRTFHAVSVGNSYESTVLKGIAAAGRGSLRTIGGEQTARSVAFELLNEVARPGLRDLQVEFRGLKVAAVYPGRLPNVPAGTQQILVGRYLPEGTDQRGEIVVTGRRGAEKVRYAAQVVLADAEAGNSFIPRLWARAHLDQLLGQGSSGAVRDEIIRLSEEFHIITPYTSLLVLETDADRERFGVRRRFEMRDGERFFAAGRDNANFELLQAQMKRASDWRTDLRRQILRDLAALGRHSDQFQRQARMTNERFARSVSVGVSDGSTRYDTRLSRLGEGFGGASGGRWVDEGGTGVVDEFGISLAMNMPYDELSSFLGRSEPAGRVDKLERLALADRWANDEDDELALGLRERDKELDELGMAERTLSDSEFDLPASGPMSAGRLAAEPGFYSFGEALGDFEEFKGGDIGRESARGTHLTSSLMSFGRRGYASPDYTSWVDTLFPALAVRPARRAAPAVEPAKWSPEAIALAKSLLRLDSLRGMPGGIELRRTTDYLDPAWNRRSGQSIDLVLASPNSWLAKPLNPREATVVNYCDAAERGVYTLQFRLGRQRVSSETERGAFPLGLSDGSLTLLYAGTAYPRARVEPAGDQRMSLVLSDRDGKDTARYTIDTARHVIVKFESIQQGKVASSTVYDDFVEVAGSWWARKVVTSDDKGRPTSQTKLDVQLLARPQFDQRMQAELVDKPTIQFLRLPLVKVATARQKVADGSAGFDDRFAMILSHAQIQQWDEMWKQVEAIEALAADESGKPDAAKPGVRWIRTLLQGTVRVHDEARKQLLVEARRLAANRTVDEVAIAEFILSQAYGQSGWAEYLEIVEAIKPVYERQAPELDLMPAWEDRFASCQEALGHVERGLELRRKIAQAQPWNVDRQCDFARRLGQAGQYDAAHAWMRTELNRPNERTSSQDEQLHTTVFNLYHAEARWADLVKFTAEWIARNPRSTSYYSPYSYHLSALVFNNQLDEAFALCDRWFLESRIEGPLGPEQRTRVDAAMNFAHGQAPNISYYRLDPRWIEPLAEMARYFLRHKHHFDLAQRAVGHSQFNQSDVADRMRGEWLRMLQTELADLNPTLISQLTAWTLSGRIELAESINGRKQLDASEVPDEVWKQIAAAVKQRWEAAAERDQKHLLSETLRSIYAARFATTELLPFLRQRLDTADADDRRQYVTALFDALLTTPWSEAVEQELFVRLRELSDDKMPGKRLGALVPALYRLNDSLLASRRAAAEKSLNDGGGLDKLTRRELAAKRAEIAKAAQEGLAQRLEQELPKADGPLAAWVRLEKAWLEIQLAKNMPEVEAFCWTLLGEVPAPMQDDFDEALADAADDDAVDQLRVAWFTAAARQRAWTTVLNLAARRNAAAASVERVLTYVDGGIKQGGPRAAVWRNTKFRVLIALDRPDDLERELREWIRGDESLAPWRMMLARLVAERGKLDEAIAIFEACQKDKLLSAADFRLLADWYLATNRREAHERSRLDSFKHASERELARIVYTVRQRWNVQGKLPTELDERALLAFQALFEKSAQPQNYCDPLRDLYATTRDFRLLKVLPDAMLGHSPQQVYGLLHNIRTQVLYEVRNEAAADEIMARIKQLRDGERTVIDRRALDLLEALVERRSTELQNQPGPHIDACLAALRRAYDRDWADGEPSLMAQLLYDLGGLPDKRLVAEQQRQLRGLLEKVPPATRDHLRITTNLSRLLFWSYGERDLALRTMEIEMRAYEDANKGVWPQADVGILGDYVSMFEGANRHADGETLLQKWIAKAVHDEQKLWLEDRLLELYNHALEHDGAVSLGTGRGKLFGPLLARLERRLEAAPNENVRHQIITRWVTTLDIANRNKVAGVRDATSRLAFEILPTALARQSNQYRHTATAPLQVVRDALGPTNVLRYIVERLEQWPQRYDAQGNDGWNAFDYELARARSDAARSQYEPRVLKLAVAELQRELRGGGQRGRHLTHHGYAYFWKEQTPAFAKAAEEVLAERNGSGRRAMAIANYLRGGLGLMPRAIEILLVANQKGILEESSQWQLASWLLESNRHAEAIPILEPLVARRPDQIQYRTSLMTSYHVSKRPQQLAELIDATDKYFHAGGRWTEGNIAELARGCLFCQQYQRSIGYFDEAIAIHQRTHPASGRNDSVLSDHYQRLASAHSALGHTKEAVDAASAAIVCWSARHENRKQAVDRLRLVFAESKDLDDYVKSLDANYEKTGQDSPLLRKSIGQTYQKQGAFDKAIVQLRLAIQLQPQDAETHRALIACLDSRGEPQAATRQLLALIDLQRHDLALYQQLAERMKDDEAAAERAATSIIESNPSEAESHAALAELRQQQNRWDEAISHWRQVATLRRLEPTGLLKTTAAQLHEKRWDEARQSLSTLERTEWPARFNDTLTSELRRLRSLLPN